MDTVQVVKRRRREVPKCPHDPGGDVVAVGAEELGEAEIRDLGVPPLVQQYVARLDVPVHHLGLQPLVQVRDPEIKPDRGTQARH